MRKRFIRSFLEQIAPNYTPERCPVILDQSNLEQMDRTHAGAVVVVGSCISNGKNLLYISRALRPYENLRIVYFNGIVRMSSGVYTTTLISNLKMGRYGADTHGFVSAETMYCNNNAKLTPWIVEVEFLKEILFNSSITVQIHTSTPWLFLRNANPCSTTPPATNLFARIKKFYVGKKVFSPARCREPMLHCRYLENSNVIAASSPIFLLYLANDSFTMPKKDYKVVLISMSGVRVHNKQLMHLGLTLPGFVERSKVIASLPSLGLLTLAAHTPENWEVLYREIDDIEESAVWEIIAERPDLVAFSALTARIEETYSLTRLLRANGMTVVIGGLHVSALPEEAQKYADAVIQGEGEQVWPVLLGDVEQGRLRPLYSSLMEKDFRFHLEASRVPRYELLDIAKYNRLTLQTSRGCPLHCSYCAASRTISSYKKKPVDKVERELNKIFEIWDRPFIELADDNTFIDKVWAKQLLRLFARYKMRWFTETDISVAYDEEILELLAGSNCAQVLIGLESSSRQTLKGIDRANWKHKQYDHYLKAIEKIQSYGISVNGCFIIGFDTDTRDTVRETKHFIRDSNLSEVQLTLLTPFPGTDLYWRLKAEKRLLAETFWNKCTLFDLNFQPAHFSVEELEGEFQELMASVYSDSSVAERKQKFRQIVKHRVMKS